MKKYVWFVFITLFILLFIGCSKNVPAEEQNQLIRSQKYVDLLLGEQYYLSYHSSFQLQQQIGNWHVCVGANQGNYITEVTDDAGKQFRYQMKENIVYYVDEEMHQLIPTKLPEKQIALLDGIDMEGLYFQRVEDGKFLERSLYSEVWGNEEKSLVFYFDQEKLVGIRIEVDGEIRQLEDVEFGEHIPERLLLIPESYHHMVANVLTNQHCHAKMSIVLM